MIALEGTGSRPRSQRRAPVRLLPEHCSGRSLRKRTLAGGELRLHLAQVINDPEREAQAVSLPAEPVVRESSGAPAAN
jgi:hypothetical protein